MKNIFIIGLLLTLATPVVWADTLVPDGFTPTSSSQESTTTTTEQVSAPTPAERELKTGTSRYVSICSVEPRRTVFKAQFVFLKNKYRVLDLKGQCSLGNPTAKTQAKILVEFEGFRIVSVWPLKIEFTGKNTQKVLSKTKDCPFNPSDPDNNIVTFFLDDSSSELKALCGKQEVDNEDRIGDLTEGYEQGSGNPTQEEQDDWWNQTPEQAAAQGDMSQPSNSGQGAGGGQENYGNQYPDDGNYDNAYQDYWDEQGDTYPIDNEDDWAEAGDDWGDSEWDDDWGDETDESEPIGEFYGEDTGFATADGLYDPFSSEDLDIGEYEELSQGGQQEFFFEEQYLSDDTSEIGNWLDNNQLQGVEYGDIDWNDYSYESFEFDEKYPGWEGEFASTFSLEEIKLAYPNISEDEYDIMNAIYAQNQSSWSINLDGELLFDEGGDKKRGWIYKILVGWYWDPIKEFFNRDVSI